MMDPITIVFRRLTNKVTDELVIAYVAAQQVQIDRDFAPLWGGLVSCSFKRPDQPSPKGAWEHWLEDHSPDPSALGFHDVTDEGVPIMHTYVGDALRDGLNWTTSASHETLETIADSDIARTVSVTKDGKTLEYAREVADAPEDDIFAYPINGVFLSAFVTPAWFDPDDVTGPYSVPPIGMIDKPFALATGGYIGVRPLGGQWTQIYAREGVGKRAVKAWVSRTMRRFSRD